MVDVRDVAKAHLGKVIVVHSEALKNSESDGERILINARSIWFEEMTQWLRKEFAPLGYKISPIVAPNWLVRFYALLKVDKQVVAIIHRLGPEIQFDNFKSRKILRLEYNEPKSALIRMVHDMINNGMVKMTTKYKNYKTLQDSKLKEPIL
ncbi:hypothetical protein DICVIV_13631 [Dictyocaulus viviparus]|uniref:Uncharacterized protein n=1 Tax=Dictyocaulus viviparus TaxID=29172 RepID=A0A0D8X797_DICVI|nr:hypothetical protein DICVIV_13631 [Dictyocaulus viviparus]